MISKISKILKQSKAIKNSHDFCIIYSETATYAIVSCDILSSKSDEFYIVDEDGCMYPGKRFFETIDYISPHNKGFTAKVNPTGSTNEFINITYCDKEDADVIHEGIGDGVAVINLEEDKIERLLYFRDTYNMPCQIKLTAGHPYLRGTYVILHYAEYSYVLNLPTYSIDVIDGTNTEAIGRFILQKPYFGYDVFCSAYSIFDVLTKQTIQLSSENGICPEDTALNFCRFDNSAKEMLICFRGDEIINKINIEHLNKTKSVDLEELFKVRETENFLLKKLLSRLDLTTLNGLPYYFFYTYYPKRFTDISDEAKNARQLIWNFKDGIIEYSEQDLTYNPKEDCQSILAKEIGAKIKELLPLSLLGKLIFVCVPASTQITHDKRYRNFSQDICKITGMINGYSKINIITEKSPKHLSPHHQDNKDVHLIDPYFFKGKQVVLFDDVVTTGKSMIHLKNELEAKGAKVICAISLGKTYNGTSILES